MLKQRVITGLILAVLVAAAIYRLSTPLFAQLSLLFIVGVGAWEWAGLTGVPDGLPRMLAPLPAMAVAQIIYWLAWPLVPVILLSVLVWAGILQLLFSYRQTTSLYREHPWMLKVLSLLVLVPAWYALVNLHATHYGYVFYLIGLIALADIGAYFVGRRFGKNKLAPELSPGKTREGAMGAVAVTLIWACLGAAIGGFGAADAFIFILFSMLAVVMSIAGDLFESLIKRQAGAKDSGTLLPGHGGVLDRIDSLLAAAPVFTLGLIWIRLG